MTIPLSLDAGSLVDDFWTEDGAIVGVAHLRLSLFAGQLPLQAANFDGDAGDPLSVRKEVDRAKDHAC